MTDENRRPKIVVLGSINMDLVGVTPRVPREGETILGESFFTAPGGKGGNQAVAAAKLGADVKMVGRVGNDTFGPVLLAGLRNHGIDVHGVMEDTDNSSGIAMILLNAKRENHIIAIYGANMACNEVQLDEAKRAMVDADALLLQLEIPLEISLEAAQYANSKGIRVIWDPAPATELPSEVFNAADVLTPNQIEAEMLTGIAVNDLDSAKAAANVLLQKGVSVAVVKLGKDGLYYAMSDGSGHIPAYSVDVVDTVAAGDAFGAGLAVALSVGQSLRDALRFGSAAGALAVTRQGAQDAMPTRKAIQEFMSSS